MYVFVILKSWQIIFPNHVIKDVLVPSKFIFLYILYTCMSMPLYAFCMRSYLNSYICFFMSIVKKPRHFAKIYKMVKFTLPRALISNVWNQISLFLFWRNHLNAYLMRDKRKYEWVEINKMKASETLVRERLVLIIAIL